MQNEIFEEINLDSQHAIFHPDNFNSPSRKRERESLEPQTSTLKKSCNAQLTSESKKMTSIEEIKKILVDFQASSKTAEIKQEDFRKSVNASLQSIESKLQQQIDVLSGRVTAIESSQVSLSNEYEHIKSEVSYLHTQSTHHANLIEQQQVECDVIARGLPSIYSNKIDEMVTILNSKLQCNMSTETVHSIRALNRKPDRHTCTYFFKFKAKHFKNDFMEAVKKFRKKDIITLEDIFEQFGGTNHSGLQISFRNSLTKHNKTLLDAALAARKSNLIEHAWERDGKIYMRKRAGDKAVQALSTGHIQHFASN